MIDAETIVKDILEETEKHVIEAEKYGDATEDYYDLNYWVAYRDGVRRIARKLGIIDAGL